jgi:hypothetical protein
LLFLVIFACVTSSCKTEAMGLDNITEIASSAQETEMQDLVTRQVETAIKANDFRTLSAMEQEFMTSRSQTPSGVWNLEIFHASLKFYLEGGLVAADGCQYRKADFVARWAAAEPRSPGPIITQAELLKEQAWCYRGNGAAPTVSEESWNQFHAGLQLARETLEAHEQMASLDPHYYAVQTTIYRGMGAPETEFQALVKQATDREPNYPKTYMNAVWYYMPQWGGSFQVTQPLRIRPDICRVLDEEDDRCARADLRSSRSF